MDIKLEKHKRRLDELAWLSLQTSKEAEMLRVCINLCTLNRFQQLFNEEAEDIPIEERFTMIHYDLNNQREDKVPREFLLEILTHPGFSRNDICSYFQCLPEYQSVIRDTPKSINHEEYDKVNYNDQKIISLPQKRKTCETHTEL